MRGTLASSLDLTESLVRPVAGVMAGRLAVVLMAFTLAITVIGAGRPGAEIAEQGVYGALAFAFLASAVYAAHFRHVRRLGRFAALQLATDIGTVTALVAFSGGVESLFSFLYLPVAVYGAILLGRRGAYAAAAGSAVGYAAGILLAPMLSGTLGGGELPDSAFALWCAHSGALLLVALLSSALVRELRLVGERLSESDERLRELRTLHGRMVTCLTSGLLTTDQVGRVTSFNPEAERIVGRAAVQVLGRHVDAVLPGVSALLKSGKASRRLRLEVADGRTGARHLGVAASILTSAAGAPAGRVVIFQDVTSVVAMENEVQRSARLAGVGQLAADIAHEIRNPLAAISGSVEMLVAGERGGEEEQERLRRIVLREIERLDGLISDFLSYARPAPAKPQELGLREIVDEVIGMFSMARPPGLELRVEVESDLRVEADPRQLRQILWNLLRNAAQAVAGPGSIGISARIVPEASQERHGRRRKGNEEGSAAVEICVSDTGPGIASEHLDRIFDPFFTTKRDGTGLGLSLVHRIVEAHEGTLQVESRPGEGARFRICLPTHPRVKEAR